MPRDQRRSVQHPVSGKTTGRCTVEKPAAPAGSATKALRLRRLHVLLKREGCEVNRKRIQRLYVEEKLQVRRRGGRKRALGTRVPMAVPDRPNARWSLDFAHDQMTDAGASASSRWSMTAPANPWHSSPIRRSPACVWQESLTSSPPVGGGRIDRLGQWHRAHLNAILGWADSAVWRGITSSRASRFRSLRGKLHRAAAG